ncbi:MAG: hypothetical protein A3B13_02280 [Candidatus Liptonbacteria bacterium RIFCSPLOWO2_01_FULL_45_15]|uniref:Uncharacterized protein n=1 Tax=Candidatus Liptonbacteria bacterium RIFCSPLOWO2_01_FULL_45_15 TaxID=1798649 RepID=A0A1G2CBU4_9BACT|nr:MAG: hypothetical protein A3B13_02280 [Candidatus Liptonbacteria bacterium RIFCSPLOWO2_01_FULL_45_15]
MNPTAPPASPAKRGESARRASGAVSGRVLVPSGSAPPIHFLIPRHLSSPRSGEVFGRGWNKKLPPDFPHTG